MTNKDSQYTDADRRHLMKSAKSYGVTAPRGASAAQIDRLIGQRIREDHEAIRTAQL